VTIQTNHNNQGNPNNPNEPENPQENENHHKTHMCPAEVCANATITAPFDFSAQANVGTIVVECAGRHIVTKHERDSKTIRFEVIQEVHAKIPIDFVTELKTFDEEVNFDVRECH